MFDRLEDLRNGCAVERCVTGREVEFIFPKRKLRITAGLLDALAPQTCETVWSVLSDSEDLKSVEGWPEKGLVRNARHAGPELFLLIPQAKKRPTVENQTFRPIPGDVMFLMIDSPNSNIGGSTDYGFWEVAIFYDRNADLEVKHAPGVEGKGWVGSRFAKVPNGQLDKLLELGNSVWSEGPERVVLRRRNR
jgi:hypothetical protein